MLPIAEEKPSPSPRQDSKDPAAGKDLTISDVVASPAFIASSSSGRRLPIGRTPLGLLLTEHLLLRRALRLLTRLLRVRTLLLSVERLLERKLLLERRSRRSHRSGLGRLQREAVRSERLHLSLQLSLQALHVLEDLLRLFVLLTTAALALSSSAATTTTTCASPAGSRGVVVVDGGTSSDSGHDEILHLLLLLGFGALLLLFPFFRFHPLFLRFQLQHLRMQDLLVLAAARVDRGRSDHRREQLVARSVFLLIRFLFVAPPCLHGLLRLVVGHILMFVGDNDRLSSRNHANGVQEDPLVVFRFRLVGGETRSAFASFGLDDTTQRVNAPVFGGIEQQTVLLLDLSIQHLDKDDSRN